MRPELYDKMMDDKATEGRQIMDKRVEIQRLWCQHCKSLQKTNNTIVECWYNPLDADRDSAFCAANEDAVNAILMIKLRYKGDKWRK